MDNLRTTLEAAVEEHDAPETVAIESAPAPQALPGTSSPADVAPEPTDSASPSPPSAVSEVQGADPDKPKPITEVVEEKAEDKQPVGPRIDRAPQSWKGDAKQVWNDLPLNVRQEVMRRERETAKVLQDTAGDRTRLNSIKEVIAPHMDRINQLYAGNPVTAINNMLNVERTMISGDPQAKVEMVARMIQHFNIDVVSLDRLLSGQGSPTPEVQQQSAIERLLEQKLAPLQQFMTTQQQREQQEHAKVEQEVEHTVESMRGDPAYPYFDEVRSDMADLIDLAAKKGLYLSLPEAYNRAVRMNDETFQASSVRDSSQAATQAALQAHQAAQKAKGASLSVSGAPSAPGNNVGNPSDLRGTIEGLFGGMGARV